MSYFLKLIPENTGTKVVMPVINEEGKVEQPLLRYPVIAWAVMVEENRGARHWDVTGDCPGFEVYPVIPSGRIEDHEEYALEYPGESDPKYEIVGIQDFGSEALLVEFWDKQGAIIKKAETDKN